MKQSVLVIVKPDGMLKNLAGKVIESFGETELELVAARLINTEDQKVKEHYSNIKTQPFFEKQVSFFLGETTGQRTLLFLIYYGEKAVTLAREIAGATNPEEANSKSIRGRFGRITTKDIYENVVHVSSDEKEAEREIKLWFSPEDILKEIYPVKKETVQSFERRTWL